MAATATGRCRGAEALRALGVLLLATQAAGEVCGVVQTDGSVRVVTPDATASTTLRCSTLIMTNCTTTEASVELCPEECPFLEMSSYSRCGHACVTAEGCGAYRPRYSLPNPVTRICEKCPAFGCHMCGVRRCIKCLKGFYLSSSGECTYETDYYLFPVFWTIVWVGVVTVVVSTVLFLACNKNTEVLRRGLEHRQRCLPHDVESMKGNDPLQEVYHSRTPLVPLCKNVHSTNIVGVGMALYYNHLAFIAIVAVMSWFILEFAEGFLSMHQWSVVNCGYGSASESKEAVAAFARRRSLTALFLWGCLLPASLVFARWQASAARTFDRVHTRMEDYVVTVRNLPANATDPLEIQEWFERIFGDRIVGVSIGYKLDGCQAQLRELLDEHIQRRETAFMAALGVPTAYAHAHLEYKRASQPSHDEAASSSTGVPSQITSDPAALLRSLKNSGEAFIVMRQEEDVETLFSLWDQPNPFQRSGSFTMFERSQGLARALRRSPTCLAPDLMPAPLPRQRRCFMGCELELLEVTSEPTSVVWDNMGVPSQVIVRRTCAGVLLFVVALLAFNGMYLSLNNYVLNFCQLAGEAPTLYHQAILGCTVGVANSLLSNAIWLGVPRLGFRRKDQADIAVFVMRFALVITNTFISIMATIRKLAAVSSSIERPPSSMSIAIEAEGDAVWRSEELGIEVALATSMFQLFFTGSFMCGLFGQILIYPWTYIQSVLSITVSFHKLTVRQAERLMEPMDIWLPWDYASHIQLPCCVFFPLLLAEPPGQCASRGLCAVLIVWCVVMYCAQRVIHLRASKATFFTTARLDIAVLYAWGLPLSLLAITAAWWAVRAVGISPLSLTSVALSVVAFIGSNVLYWMGLHMALQHQSTISSLYATKSESYEAALAQNRYSYFNTNPAYVLMSERLPDMKLPSTTWYESGKAYLQTVDPRIDAQLEAAMYAVEYAPGRPGQRKMQSQAFVSRMLYSARVWLLGAPQNAYSSVDEGVSESQGMFGSSNLRW